MTAQAVRLVLCKRPPRRASPTPPRIATAQGLAGHAQVTTTAAYDRRLAATRRKAAELVHVPYRRRRAT